MAVEDWIAAASAEQVQAKIAEYEGQARLESPRDAEMRHKLLVKLRRALADKL